uniref:Uncharacterized protein n=1 Tax=Physcomitrium patens TaxID=3218 RepID=A0A7I3YUM5_PHYPA
MLVMKVEVCVCSFFFFFFFFFLTQSLLEKDALINHPSTPLAKCEPVWTRFRSVPMLFTHSLHNSAAQESNMNSSSEQPLSIYRHGINSSPLWLLMLRLSGLLGCFVEICASRILRRSAAVMESSFPCDSQCVLDWWIRGLKLLGSGTDCVVV